MWPALASSSEPPRRCGWPGACEVRRQLLWSGRMRLARSRRPRAGPSRRPGSGRSRELGRQHAGGDSLAGNVPMISRGRGTWSGGMISQKSPDTGPAGAKYASSVQSPRTMLVSGKEPALDPARHLEALSRSRRWLREVADAEPNQRVGVEQLRLDGRGTSHIGPRTGRDELEGRVQLRREVWESSSPAPVPAVARCRRSRRSKTCPEPFRG